MCILVPRRQPERRLLSVIPVIEEYHPDMSCASWAIRFAASLDGIITVLSGMSNTAQMEDNLSYMKQFRPLDEEEQKIIREAQKILGKSAAIPCTSCHYCTEGCPIAEAVSDYQKATGSGGQASICISCGQCERVCPQHLKVTEYLKQCAAKLE